MFAQAFLLIAFVCNVSGTPYVVTDPKDLHSTWSSDDYKATHDTHSIRWEFTVKGRNGVPDPGNFAASCHGLQVISDDLDLTGKPDFERCNDTAYEARQYFSGEYTTVEVRRTDYPDLGKEVQISATANYTSTNDNIVNGHLKFGDFQTKFIPTPIEG
ncbi:hypothetical protein IWW34DRAFT_865613 [Fusarium oxysporum f. sp. albedinis]|nr:hypothetical protein FOMA001_g7262 [Fusarium oxysporum f. sp. matthiolae]KAI3581981.1 hypothetical protein IWW34DRAFT_865613 [Fusarium oxysporum f. sp. albedinis]KAJ0139525.1 Uncharacterized protein HZ326_17561 [Fusarium oxysporum f. sp. albedinis]KAK2484576.1 hypothetical protein H9L39_02556 [Fusarium oxysporum f. sp. albedinis]